jgi:hypothetical protein
MSSSRGGGSSQTARPRVARAGRADPYAGGRAKGNYTEVFAGIDVAKARNSIAISDGERGGEVRFPVFATRQDHGLRALSPHQLAWP